MDTPQKAWALAWRGSTEELGMPPAQREWGFLWAEDWFCTKWILVHPGWPGGPS